MRVSEGLIQKFFNDSCTSEEAEVVSRYLKQHPEMLDKYLGADDWAEPETPISDELRNESWEHIQDAIGRKTSRIFNWRGLSIAASVALLIGAGYYYNRTIPSVLPAVPVAVNNYHTIYNNSNHDTAIFFADHSVAILSANSEIGFDKPFPANKRDILLKGKAFFKVAKDKERPFTVYTDKVSTTALGTEFFVTCYAGAPTIEVYLVEGKVMVKSAPGAVGSHILMPGEMLTYNRLKKTAKVTDNNKAIIAKNTDSGASRTTGNWHVFKKEPLASVFMRLSVIYNVTIDYNQTDLQERFFIGKFSKSESLENILGTICKLNDLEMEKIRQDRYRIVRAVH